MIARRVAHPMKAVLLLCLLLLAAPAVAGAAQPASVGASPSAAVAAASTSGNPSTYLTLEQAVAKVQKQTHGKVLRAGKRRYGDLIEYRIKVLTADGHVRVVPLRTHTPAAPETSSEEIH